VRRRWVLGRLGGRTASDNSHGQREKNFEKRKINP
jgi:hypothetical protein